MRDFVVKNGVLTKYTGPGGDVVIPDGVTSIEKEAFARCYALTSVTIPEGVRYIGSAAFAHCANLISVHIPRSCSLSGRRELSDVFFGTRPRVIRAPGKPLTQFSLFEKPAVLGHVQLVAEGMEFPAGEERTYRTYIRKWRESLYPDAIAYPELLRYMISRGLIPAAELELVLTLADKAGRPDLKAELLQYAHTAFPRHSWNLNL